MWPKFTEEELASVKTIPTKPFFPLPPREREVIDGKRVDLVGDAWSITGDA